MTLLDNDCLFHCVIHVQKHFSKKNQKTIRRSKRTGKQFIGTRDRESLLERDLVIKLTKKMLELGVSSPFLGPLRLKALFHYPDTAKGQQTKRVIDLSNLIQGPEDALQKCGLIEDDKQIESYDGTRRVYGSESPMIEVFLYPFKV